MTHKYLGSQPQPQIQRKGKKVPDDYTINQNDWKKWLNKYQAKKIQNNNTKEKLER